LGWWWGFGVGPFRSRVFFFFFFTVDSDVFVLLHHIYSIFDCCLELECVGILFVSEAERCAQILFQ